MPAVRCQCGGRLERGEWCDLCGETYEDAAGRQHEGLTHIAPVVERVLGRLLTLAMAALVGGGSALWR